MYLAVIFICIYLYIYVNICNVFTGYSRMKGDKLTGVGSELEFFGYKE